MKVKVLREAGFEEALIGISLSYKTGIPDKKVADRLCWQQGGHNKFLEHLIAWIDVTAPRYWWQEMDTYRVGTSKQSEATIHTLLKRELVHRDFQDGCDERILAVINECIRNKDLYRAKRFLPESFFQRRIVCTNYKTLQNMCMQRKNHKLPEWGLFIEELQKQLEHPEYVLRGE